MGVLNDLNDVEENIQTEQTELELNLFLTSLMQRFRVRFRSVTEVSIAV